MRFNQLSVGRRLNIGFGLVLMILVAVTTVGVMKVQAINAALRSAAAQSLDGILAYETEPIVSSDILHSTFSGTFDSLSTMVVGGRVSKTLTFYDNGWGYCHRAIELLRRLSTFAAGEQR